MKPSIRDIFQIVLICFSCTLHLDAQPVQGKSDSISHIQIKADSLFQSSQQINMLILDKEQLPGYSIDFAYKTGGLQKTSQFAIQKNAVAAINGSFFNMDEGGNVTYFERNDSVISRSRESHLKWAVPDSLANAALIYFKNGRLEIEAARSLQIYEQSGSEHFVMVTGPLLLKDSIAQKLPDMSFSHNRHPRTCVAISHDALHFISIDGRSEKAEGMSLREVQEYLLHLGCLDAINLDGGGSTTMWIHGKGVVNSPSDKSGERTVANALLILKK